MFAKKISSEEYDEKSKMAVLDMINSDSPSMNNLNRDDVLRQKRLISLKEQAIKTDGKEDLTENEKNIKELVEFHSKYDKLLTEYRFIYLDYETIQTNESKLKEKIKSLTDDLNESANNCKQLIAETEELESHIKQHKLDYNKLKYDFYMYKIRIVGMIVVSFAILVGVYLHTNSYIW